MRARLPDLAVAARARGAALAAFTCYDLTTATGVVTAAQDAESPVVLLVSSVTASGPHGSYSAAPQLDWSRMDAIRAATDVPLVLHGASGLASTDRDRAVSAGVCKFNINTELRQTVFDAVSGAVHAEQQRGLDLNSLLGTWRSAVAHRVFTAIGDLNSNGVSA